MTINIESPDRYRLAETKRIEVHGLPGLGTCTLVLRLDLGIVPPKTDTYLENLWIRVEWCDNRQRMLGTAMPDESHSIRISPHHNELNLNFRIPLSFGQIEAIEALRNGGDFRLVVWLSVQVRQGSDTSGSYGRAEFDVRQQDWIRALQEMEYQRTFLYELPLPKNDRPEEPAAGIICKAQQYLLSGHYDQCVGECRKLLEAYSLGEADEQLLKTAREKYKGDRTARESMEIPERLLVLRESLTHATHPAHHHNTSDGYSRDQARAILGASISVLAAFARKDPV
jgi:hypothetical protein